jgi:N6-adenosine-specific RNA methylase IME4
MSDLLTDMQGQKFRCIVADPPWDVKRGAPQGRPKGVQMASQPLPYPTMTVDQIAAMPVSGVADKAAHLYLWTINRYVEQAYAVARAWGFAPSTLLVWAKTPKGLALGGTYALATEFCLFARRGTLAAARREESNWWHWKRGRHSAKPEAFQDMVEKVSPGPRLELFARRARPGWTVWGNEVEANTTAEGRRGAPYPPAAGSTGDCHAD